MKLGDLFRRKSSDEAASGDVPQLPEAVVSAAPRHANGSVEAIAAVSSEGSTMYLYREADELWAAWDGSAAGAMFGRKLTPTEPFPVEQGLREVGMNGHSVQLHEDEFLVILDGKTFLLDPLAE